MTITTNAQGVATTGPNDLPYGDYLVREKSTNNSMLLTFTEEIPVTVSENGKVYPFTAENDVVRGGIEIQKHDSQTGATPQGNADFAGITFEIVNVSANPVVVEASRLLPTRWRQQSPPMKTVTPVPPMMPCPMAGTSSERKKPTNPCS